MIRIRGKGIMLGRVTNKIFRLGFVLFFSTFILISCGGSGGGGQDPASYTVSTNTSNNGSISPTSFTVTAGSTAIFTITPDTGFTIGTVTGCVGTLTGNTYTTGEINSDCTVTASFVAITHTVSTSADANGSISPTSATVNEGGSTSFSITPNSGFMIGTVTGCDGSLTGNTYTTAAITNDCTVSASFVAITHTVSTSAGVNGSLSPTSTIVNEGGSTSFSITPNSGFMIGTVKGCDGSLTGNTYTTAAITNDCTVSASFVAITHTVSTSADANGSISPTSATVNEGGSTSFSITPNSGFTIGTITGCGGSLTGNTYTTAAITNDCTVSASFVAITHMVSTSVGGNGSLSPTSTIVNEGDSTSFTVTPNSGFIIDTVTGCSGSLSGNTYTTGVINSDCTVTASFSAITHTVSTSAGANGSLSPTSAIVNEGSNTSFIVSPLSGFEIDTVTGCNGALAGNAFTTGIITVDCTVTASFKVITHTVSVSTSAYGSVSATNVTVNDGEGTSFTITPDPGFHIDTVTGCGGTLTASTYTMAAISADCSVTVKFSSDNVLPAVSPLYSNNGVNWNDYIKNDGINTYSAMDVAADGTETDGYQTVIHGGEFRSLEVTGINSCVGLTAQDELNAFEWICVDTTLPVRMVSTGLRADKNLSDLLDFNAAAWKENHVTVIDNGVVFGQSPWTAWWSNPVIVDNDGSDGLDMSAGDIRIITANPAAAYSLGQDKVALVVDPAVTLTGSSETAEKLVMAFDRRYLWIEGQLDTTTDHIGVDWAEVRFSVLRNVTARYGNYGILFFNSLNNSISKVIASNNGTGILIGTGSEDNTLTEITVSNNKGHGIYIGSSNNTISQIWVTDNTAVGLYLSSGSNNTVSNIEASGNYSGVGLYSNSANNTFSNIASLNNAHGFYLDTGSTNNTFSNMTASNNLTGGIYLIGSAYNTFTNVRLSNNNSHGISLDASSNNKISRVAAIHNTFGIALQNGSNNNVLSDLKTINNFQGLTLNNSSNNTLSHLLTAHNNVGVQIIDSSSNALSHVTATNNLFGFYVSAASNNLFSQVMTHNNKAGISIYGGSYNTVSDLIATNGVYGISLFTVMNNKFTGKLIVGNNTNGDCAVFVNEPDGGINPGLDNDYTDGFNDEQLDGACLTQGSSDFGTAITDMTMSLSFVGKLTTDDTSNTSDIAGSADFPADPAVFDWTNFDNFYRAWGKTIFFLDPFSFPATRWEAGPGTIWDWSLLSTDTVAREVFSLPTGDDTLTHTWDDESTTVFLRNAAEIQHDNIGNDNGLCETGETCLFTPNMGSYQGHDALVSAGAFSDGTLTGITLLRYAINGK